MAQDRLMLIDGNSLMYRAFYALPLLRTRKGVFTNAVYGFLNMFFKVKKEYMPSHIVVAFDMDRQTLRAAEFNGYKIHRKPTPPELREQFIILREVLQALDVDYVEMQGYEGDDIIGTLTRLAVEQGLPCLVVTGDQDALQLVSPAVEVLITKKGISEMEKYDLAAVLQKWEVPPEKLPDVKGLMGDASDNIPGVPGVGKKTAIKLVKDFGSIEGIYANLEEVPSARLREILAANREQALLSKKLATIMKDVPLEVSFDEYRRQVPDHAGLLELYRELEFNSFLKDLQEESTAGEHIPVTVQLESPRQIEELVNRVQPGETVFVYLSIDYHHPMWARPVAIHLVWQDRCYEVDLKERATERLDYLRPVLEDARVKKYFHNSKYAQVFFQRYGISLRGVEGDTLLLSYVLDPGYQGETLTEHLFHYLGEVVDEKENPALAVSRLQALHDLLASKVREEDLFDLYRKLELPLSEVLGGMEFTGVNVDRKVLEEIAVELEARIARAELRVFELAGQEFNINSTRQLGAILFERLGLPPVKKTKTGYSTSAEVLEELYEAHEIIGHIIDYRTLTKLKSTYVDTLPGYIHPDTGRIHTIFKQAVTATGRLSSVEPNLQNIPIRLEEGRRIRRAFVARDASHLLLAADYSQIDLRSLAHISGDETLIDTFRRGIDIHARTAAEIWKIPLDKVDASLRRKAKAVNFGIIYGISDFGLARGTGVSRREAGEYIKKYLDSYPGVRQFMQDIVATGRERGYVSTLLGRRRYLPDLLSSNRAVRAMAERMALNAPIQGTSADIIKLAMLAVDEELRKRQLLARMVLQVHDELVFDVPREEMEVVASLVKHSMENAYQLKVPLEVSLKVGHNWYDMTPWGRDDA